MYYVQIYHYAPELVAESRWTFGCYLEEYQEFLAACVSGSSCFWHACGGGFMRWRTTVCILGACVWGVNTSTIRPACGWFLFVFYCGDPGQMGGRSSEVFRMTWVPCHVWWAWSLSSTSWWGWWSHRRRRPPGCWVSALSSLQHPGPSLLYSFTCCLFLSLSFVHKLSVYHTYSSLLCLQAIFSLFNNALSISSLLFIRPPYFCPFHFPHLPIYPFEHPLYPCLLPPSPSLPFHSYLLSLSPLFFRSLSPSLFPNDSLRPVYILPPFSFSINLSPLSFYICHLPVVAHLNCNQWIAAQALRPIWAAQIACIYIYWELLYSHPLQIFRPFPRISGTSPPPFPSPSPWITRVALRPH